MERGPFVLLLLCLAAVPASFAQTTYDYDARAVVAETITDEGGGFWRYDYALTNNDTDTIWFVNVWFANIPVAVGPLTTWTGHESSWSSNYSSSPALHLPGPQEQPFEYYTWGHDWPYGPDQISIGETRSGASIVLQMYDPSPKQFGYLIDGHYWLENHLDAVGWTPEPGTALLFGVGLTLLRRR